jgi:hypothetical protein
MATGDPICAHGNYAVLCRACRYGDFDINAAFRALFGDGLHKEPFSKQTFKPVSELEKRITDLEQKNSALELELGKRTAMLITYINAFKKLKFIFDKINLE